ncbi:MAG TPA: hypothetical protein PLS20_00035 [Ruminococcus flavefaciens]|nr:hypothetical protein [Ruminococcus flavefaciens]
MDSKIIKFAVGGSKSAIKVLYDEKAPLPIKLITEFIKGGKEYSEEEIVKEIKGIMSKPVLPIYITGALIPLHDDVDLEKFKETIDEYKDNSRNYIRNITVLDENNLYINDILCHEIQKSKYLVFDFWDRDGSRDSLFRFKSSYLDNITEYYEEITEKYSESTGESCSIINELYVF